uniref:Uncharacterized protein n=1 Tax=Amphiprion ocellaris TaxID=80972 RepID=A0A3Q1CNR3_AMPOC
IDQAIKGQTEVTSPEQCDYLLVFCPVASRVGTDISEALDHIPAGKQAVLVVMHHTFNHHHVIAASSRLVQNPNILLTVDCLFHDNKLLNCDLNNKMWHEVYNFLGKFVPCTRDISGHFEYGHIHPSGSFNFSSSYLKKFSCPTISYLPFFFLLCIRMILCKTCIKNICF